MVVVLDKDFFVDFSCLETIMGSMGKKNDNPELNITTSEEWNSLQEQDGLSVIDVYSKWAGPCSVMRPVILKAKAKVHMRFPSFTNCLIVINVNITLHSTTCQNL